MGIIRFLLAIAVCDSHYPVMEWDIVDGHEAVLTFFAISGFYMALILDRSYPNARSFYLSRFVSLYPMYVFAVTVSVALLVSLDVHPMTSRETVASLMEDPVSALALTWSSVCVVGQEMLFSLAPASEGGLHFVTASGHALYSHVPLVQAWSLSLEAVFYALAPALVALRTRTLLVLAGASLLAKVAVMYTGMAEIELLKRFFPIEFWLFAGGALSYRAFAQLAPEPRAWDYLAFAVLVAAVFLASEAPKGAEPFALPAAALVSMPFVFRGFRRFSFDRLVGKISYPFYLLHFSVIAVFDAFFEEPSGLVIFLMTLTAATFTHSLFSLATDPLKRKLRLAPLPAVAYQTARI